MEAITVLFDRKPSPEKITPTSSGRYTHSPCSNSPGNLRNAGEQRDKGARRISLVPETGYNVSKNPVSMKNSLQSIDLFPETGFFRWNIFHFGLLLEGQNLHKINIELVAQGSRPVATSSSCLSTNRVMNERQSLAAMASCVSPRFS